MVGERVGNYQIVQRLAEGGMGTVYLASHPELGRRVAVKVLRPELAQSDEMVQRFFNEARAASDIGHRGIVEVFDLGTLPSGAPYIVMELLDGESLAERLTRKGPLLPGMALEIAGQAASVMVAAHAKGIIHRDLKPDNLYLIPDPHLPGRELLKILDFGIAKLAPRPSAGGDLRTRTGTVLGTPRYMSPEQCRESRDVDHRSDVYSLGVVLYEMLAGSPPFVSSSWGELAHMHIGVSPPALQTLMPDVPERIAHIVHRALEKDPGARFQSMAELEEALDAATDARTAGLPTPVVTAAAGSDPSDAASPGPEPRGARAPAATWRVGSTRRFADEPPARPTRATTLAGAASEVVPQPGKSKRRVPMRPSLVIATAVALVGIAGALAVRRASRPVFAPMSTSAPAPVPVPAPPPPAPRLPVPAAAPPPRIVEPAPEPAPAPRASGAPERPPRQRKRPPAKPAVPAPAIRRPEPLKV